MRIPGGLDDRLEQLCRYAARPPIALDRLTRADDGTLLYKLERRYRDGSTHVVFTPHTLIERLCVLIPRPRRKLVTYHGVPAPAAGLGDRVVPDPVHRTGDDRDPEPPDDPIRRLGIGSRSQPPVPQAPSRHRGPRKAYTWAELKQRVHRRGQATAAATAAVVTGRVVIAGVQAAEPRGPGPVCRHAPKPGLSSLPLQGGTTRNRTDSSAHRPGSRSPPPQAGREDPLGLPIPLRTRAPAPGASAGLLDETSLTPAERRAVLRLLLERH